MNRRTIRICLRHDVAYLVLGPGAKDLAQALGAQFPLSVQAISGPGLLAVADEVDCRLLRCRKEWQGRQQQHLEEPHGRWLGDVGGAGGGVLAEI